MVIIDSDRDMSPNLKHIHTNYPVRPTHRQFSLFFSPCTLPALRKLELWEVGLLQPQFIDLNFNAVVAWSTAGLYTEMEPISFLLLC